MNKEKIESIKAAYKRKNIEEGDVDLKMYEMRYEQNKPVNSIAYECGYSVESVYRRTKKVKSFLENNQYEFDLDALTYYAPEHTILKGCESRVSCVITQMAIALFKKYNTNCIEQYYYKALGKEYPGIKNCKNQLEKELMGVYWWNYKSFEKRLIFKSIRLEKNLIQFTLNSEVAIWLMAIDFLEKNKDLEKNLS